MSDDAIANTIKQHLASSSGQSAIEYAIAQTLKLVSEEERPKYLELVKDYKPETNVVQLTESIVKGWKHPALHRDITGKIMKNPTNLFTILQNHPSFKGRLSFNEMTLEHFFDGKAIQDSDYTKMRLELCNQLILDFKEADVVKFSQEVARGNPFHPIRQYLQSLQWDGKDRFAAFLQTLKIEDTPINLEVIRKWLIAAVARACKPGCKVDSMLVLKGATGLRKSTAIRVLVPDEDYFTDEHINFGDKDSKMLVHGRWIVEVGELAALSKKEQSIIKADITIQEDAFRLPYGRTITKHPRQFIYAGTTNEDRFLDDPTSNRRFWVVEVLDVIDTDAITAMRDQLWAQAYANYKAGEPWHLGKESEAEMAAIGKRYAMKDPWEDEIAAYIADGGLDRITVEELRCILTGYKCDKYNDKRIVGGLKALGWKGTTIYLLETGQKVWGYLPPKPSPVPIPKGVPVVATERESQASPEGEFAL